MTALELLEWHEKGAYTLLEVVSHYIRAYHLAEIRTLPLELQNHVLDALANSPKTEEEWARAIFICPEGPTQEVLRAETRTAVEALRKELDEEQRRAGQK